MSDSNSQGRATVNSASASSVPTTSAAMTPGSPKIPDEANKPNSAQLTTESTSLEQETNGSPRPGEPEQALAEDPVPDESSVYTTNGADMAPTSSFGGRVDVSSEDGDFEDSSDNIGKNTGSQKVSSDAAEVSEPSSVPSTEEEALSESSHGLNDASSVEPTLLAPDEPQAAADLLPPRTYISKSIGTSASGATEPSSKAQSLLEARQSEISVKFDSKDVSQQQSINSGVESVKKTFRDIRDTIGQLPSELLGGSAIDWELWGRVVNNYHEMVLNDQDELVRAVTAGIPKEIRGIIWQLVARSKSLQLEELYMQLKAEPSVHERAIKRDLTRTSFYTNVDAADKAGELYNVIMSYSNFDPDVGYTQGMVFIAVPLVMNMTEGECFCLLVTLMKDYGLRELFCPEMKGLHLLLHQFDRLLEQRSPLLYNHLTRQGIRSSMYASQWFLTFFSYKFPLDVVLRIFDMVITQGIEAVLRLALNLMLQNENNLMLLTFDALLDYLKSSLFNVYVSSDFLKGEPQENKRFSLLARKPSVKSSEYYRLDAFIDDAMSVEVNPLDLARYKAEFDQMIEKDLLRTEEIERLRASNGKLRHEIKQVEKELYMLNHEHMDAVQTLVNTKVSLPELLGEIEEMKQCVASLEADIAEMNSKLGANRETIPQDIEARIQELLEQNAQETERFSNLEEQLNQLTLEDENLTAELKRSKKWFWKK